MKLSIKSTSIILGVIGLAFVGGIALTSHMNPSTPIVAFKSTADTTTTASTDPIATPAPASPQTTTTTTTAPIAANTTPSTSTTVTSTATSSSPSSTLSATTSTTTTPSASTTPAVTAVSATLSDWSAPVDGPGGTMIEPSTVQSQYCIFTYSDSSTKSILHATRAVYADGLRSEGEGAACTIANAPAAS
ncbi:MAG TPA: hypothetical protein VNG51_19505 [Ktedonobacteraceae bacterium]|nr:hypothetical protein [Ktedonobacteraceae bacterium]